jgi:MFS family permease
MRHFTVLWLGQVISLLGSAMTWFAFTLWAWQKTEQASTLATISFFAFLPTVLLTPIAGTFVDRWNRKLVMLLSDLGAALGTLAALLLFLSDKLEIWHVYLISLLAGFFTAFQYPAYNAAVTTMLPREQYMRAEGMLGLAPAISTVFAPLAAAVLLPRIGITGIMTLDLLTFGAAFVSLLLIRVPQPVASEVGAQSRGSFWQETGFGFRYIHQHASLRGLVILFMAANFFIAIGATLLAPMILSRTGNSETALASVQSVGAVGGLVGGTALSLWGGPKRRIHSILLGGAGACLLGITWLGLSSTILFWAIGSFFFSFFEPFVEGGNLALWLSKVEADVQGRVFSARHLLVQIPYLLGTFASGYLADSLGLSLMLVLAGLAGLAVFLTGYTARTIRQTELLLPNQPGG